MSTKALTKKREKTVADFFAGIGLVSLGLDNAGWETVYALDYDTEKAAAYNNHFGSGHYHIEDIGKTEGGGVPKVVLAHASFPCTDLSVAGGRKGIRHGESSAFWHFIRIISEMKERYGENSPPLIMLENVEGLLTSAGGKDLKSVLTALNEMNYQVDLLRINAAHFVPQSRVRLFIIGIHASVAKKLDHHPLKQIHNLGSSNARSQRIIEYVEKNSDIQWYFHSLPHLPERKVALESIIDGEAKWWSEDKTRYLRGQLHNRHARMLDELKEKETYSYFPAFRRMRERDGMQKSTVELRTDGIAGCLRTPKGGSARQILVRVGKGEINARLINEKEAAHLMGAAKYKLNSSLSLNQVLFGFGDAVCVNAVEWLAKNYLNNLPV